ncbi:GNAT family N-acetyltransferase [Streptomyces sp. 6N223]|uniref:GNAT family N-acetyltransferase n=1 Tax=Streptomyces sp. 6N223 TaxID=3457412 RepID=UPI003FD35A6A
MHHAIERLTPDAFPDAVKGLAALLATAVQHGDSLNFLSPFDEDAAATWWHSRAPAVADGRLIVWTWRNRDDAVTGTISLALDSTPNGRHRAHVLKLIVHPTARRQGLARALLTTAENAAANAGRTLLILDTETASPAERLYLTAGWTRYGTVPAYAADPEGDLRDCSFFYKRL